MPQDVDLLMRGRGYDCKPIVRQNEDLVREITQDGKRIVPIVELAKKTTGRDDIFVNEIVFNEEGAFVRFDNDYVLGYALSENSFGIYDRHNVIYTVSNQLELFQMLLSWHFVPQRGLDWEVVYTSQDCDPYI